MDGRMDRLERFCVYVIIRPQTEHNLTVHVPTLQPPVQTIVRGSKDSRQDVRRGDDLM